LERYSLSQRPQDELPLSESRMRNDQSSFLRFELNGFVVVEDQVEIDHSRPVGEGFGSSDGGFDLLEETKKEERGEGGGDLRKERETRRRRSQLNRSSSEEARATLRDMRLK